MKGNVWKEQEGEEKHISKGKKNSASTLHVLMYIIRILYINVNNRTQSNSEQTCTTHCTHHNVSSGFFFFFFLLFGKYEPISFKAIEIRSVVFSIQSSVHTHTYVLMFNVWQLFSQDPAIDRFRLRWKGGIPCAYSLVYIYGPEMLYIVHVFARCIQMSQDKNDCTSQQAQAMKFMNFMNFAFLFLFFL